MNHCVPEFNMPCSSSSSSRHPKAIMQEEDEMMELLWEDGQVVMHTQKQAAALASVEAAPISRDSPTNLNLFMEEDEMNEWLQNNSSSFNQDFTDLFSAEPRPPPPPPPPPRAGINFPQFNRSNNTGAAGTVVESTHTPLMMRHDSVTNINPPWYGSDSTSISIGERERERKTSSITIDTPRVDRKRKAVDETITEEHDQSEEVETESYDTNTQARTSGTKRSRASEIHNLSERKRRDRINERMKALQELIPRCSKTDKASMLDEAIEYLKSLQLQVQMMSLSMGCGMVPMMFPGFQQYMPSLGMGMAMGMHRAFPSAASGSPWPTHMNTGFPLQAFPMHPIPEQDPSRMHQVNVSGNPLVIPNLSDPYQRYMGSMPTQTQMQTQMPQPSTCKPTTHKGGGDKDGEKHFRD